jgi:CubicO group peptidase (beta-lactamase class C family)
MLPGGSVKSWIAMAALLLAATASAQADDSAWIEAQRAQWQVPGVAVAIVDAKSPPQLLVHGLCNVEQRLPCTARSTFPIASNTKFFTGLLAAVLAQQKKLRLDAPLAGTWPDLQLGDARASTVTLFDLLSHRSGLGSVDWPYLWDASLTRDDYLDRLRHVPMAIPFRDGWHYANANYVVAGAYLERVTRRDWQTLVREHLIAPLRMRDAGFGLPTDGTRGYVQGAGGEPLVPAGAWSAEALAPAGALVLSARDYARLLAAVVGTPDPGESPPIARAAIKMATRPWAANAHDPQVFNGPGGYGLGLFSATYRGDDIRYHVGRTTGFTTAVVMLPQRGLAVAVMSNLNNTNFAAALALALLDRRLGRSGDATMQAWSALRGDRSAPDQSQATAGDPMPVPAEYVGRYAHPAWGTFAIVPVADALRIRMAQLDAPLLRLGPERFEFEAVRGWPPMRLTFTTGGAGHVDGFTLEDGENTAPMRFDRVRHTLSAD